MVPVDRAVTRVVYQGEPGAFSEEAVLRFFGEASERTAVPTWRAVFEAVADEAAERGVIAIESSLAGTIRETYDLLAEFYDRDVRIVGEVAVPVRLALLALPGQSLEAIGGTIARIAPTIAIGRPMAPAMLSRPLSSTDSDWPRTVALASPPASRFREGR